MQTLLTQRSKQLYLGILGLKQNIENNLEMLDCVYHLIKYDLSLYFIKQYVCFRYSLAIAPVGAPVNVDIPVSKLTSLTLHLDRILAFLIELAALFNHTFVQVLDTKTSHWQHLLPCFIKKIINKNIYL